MDITQLALIGAILAALSRILNRFRKKFEKKGLDKYDKILGFFDDVVFFSMAMILIMCLYHFSGLFAKRIMIRIVLTIFYLLLVALIIILIIIRGSHKQERQSGMMTINMDHHQEIVKKEKLWYYEVPQKCVMFEEDFFDVGDFTQWSEIDFVRKTHFTEKCDLPDALCAPVFLTKLFWYFKKDDEKISVKLPEATGRHMTIRETDPFETKEAFLEMAEYITGSWRQSGIVYRAGTEMRRAVYLQPSEQMYIYLKREDLPRVKEYLSQFAMETEYYAYQSGEIE